ATPAAPTPETIASAPPKFSQLLHFFPSHHLWATEPLVARPQMSSRPGPQDEMSGSSVMFPPRSSLCQELPSHHQWSTVFSVERATTSMRLLPHETAPGPEARVPPRLSQPLQLFPSHHLCQRALSVPF